MYEKIVELYVVSEKNIISCSHWFPCRWLNKVCIRHNLLLFSSFFMRWSSENIAYVYVFKIRSRIFNIRANRIYWQRTRISWIKIFGNWIINNNNFSSNNINMSRIKNCNDNSDNIFGVRVIDASNGEYWAWIFEEWEWLDIWRAKFVTICPQPLSSTFIHPLSLNL